MFCTKCGHPIEDGETKCRHCGHEISGGKETEVQTGVLMTVEPTPKKKVKAKFTGVVVVFALLAVIAAGFKIIGSRKPN